MVLLTTDWIRPDILTIAKGLGKGIPIGACLTDKKLGHLLKLGLHGSTFGGNPLACRLAHTVLDFLEKQYLQNVADRGDKLLGLLQSRLTGLKNIQSVRGVDLMIGIELIHPVEYHTRQCNSLITAPYYD
jgi:acetylornithine aminotransferase